MPGRVCHGRVAGECVLEVGDAMLQPEDLGPEPVAFAGEFGDPLGELGGRVVTVQGVERVKLSVYVAG